MYFILFILALAPVIAFGGSSQSCDETPRPRGHAPAAAGGAARAPTPAERRQIASRQYNELYRKLVYDSNYRNVDAEAARLRTLGAQAGVGSWPVNSLIGFLHDRGVAAVNRQRASCGGSYDYSARMGAVRNQDSVGWCYAFVLADALSFKSGRRISAAGIATSYNSYWRWIYNLFQPYCGEARAGWGGNESMASFVAARRGLCLESEFPSEDNNGGRIYDNIRNFESAARARSPAQFETCAREMFPNLKHEDIMAVLRTSNQQELIKSLSDRACVHRVPMPKASVTYYSGLLNSPDTLLSRIDQSLSAGSIATMSYTVEALYNIDSNKREGSHTSSVIGRKWDTQKNECVYLIRNSYGPGCRQYDRRLECKNGNIWVPRSVLSKGITDVSIIR